MESHLRPYTTAQSSETRLISLRRSRSAPAARGARETIERRAPRPHIKRPRAPGAAGAGPDGGAEGAVSHHARSITRRNDENLSRPATPRPWRAPGRPVRRCLRRRAVDTSHRNRNCRSSASADGAEEVPHAARRRSGRVRGKKRKSDDGEN